MINQSAKEAGPTGRSGPNGTTPVSLHGPNGRDQLRAESELSEKLDAAVNKIRRLRADLNECDRFMARDRQQLAQSWMRAERLETEIGELSAELTRRTS